MRYEITVAHRLTQPTVERVVAAEARQLGLSLKLRHERGYAAAWDDHGLESTVEVVIYDKDARRVRILAGRLQILFDQEAVLLVESAAVEELMGRRDRAGSAGFIIRRMRASTALPSRTRVPRRQPLRASLRWCRRYAHNGSFRASARDQKKWWMVGPAGAPATELTPIRLQPWRAHSFMWAARSGVLAGH